MATSTRSTPCRRGAATARPATSGAASVMAAAPLKNVRRVSAPRDVARLSRSCCPANSGEGKESPLSRLAANVIIPPCAVVPEGSLRDTSSTGTHHPARREFSAPVRRHVAVHSWPGSVATWIGDAAAPARTISTARRPSPATSPARQRSPRWCRTRGNRHRLPWHRRRRSCPSRAPRRSRPGR